MRLIQLLMVVIAVLVAPLERTWAGDGSDAKPLVFGIVPARSPDKILRDFAPLAQLLRSQLDVAVELRSAPNYETFIRRAVDGDIYDIVLTGGDTLQYMRDHGHYHPLVQMAGPGVYAVIAVERNSSIQALDDLRGGARVATADLLAYSSGLGMKTLANNGIDSVRDLDLVVVPSQSASLSSLLSGQVDAAIVMIPVVRSASLEVQRRLRILKETDRAPPPAISVSTKLPTELVLRFQDLLLNLKNTERGNVVLAAMGWPGFAPVKLDDYNALDWAASSIADRLRLQNN